MTSAANASAATNAHVSDLAIRANPRTRAVMLRRPFHRSESEQQPTPMACSNESDARWVAADAAGMLSLLAKV